MSSVLLALWGMLFAADRIDFVGGNGPFILTPFLALTPLVLLGELVRRRLANRPLRFTTPALAYLLVSAALVSVALISVFFSRELGVAGSRAMLLLADILGTFIVALVCSDREDLFLVLARGAMASLILFVIFDVVEAQWFLGRGPEIWRLGPMSARFDQLQNAGPIPRLAGPVADGNRAGFALLFYFVVIARGERIVWLRRTALWLAGLLLVATLSRSTALAVAAALGAAAVGGRLRVTAASGLVATLAVAATVVALMARPQLVTALEAALDSPAAARLSAQEGSAQSHLALIRRGVEEGMESIPSAAIGIGYGNSYLVLQDVFPGNKYGNFHSLYVTMFAEAGIGALLLMLLLMTAPLVGSPDWRPLLAGALAFNVFYQTVTEPAFWFMLALAWLAMGAAPAFVMRRATASFAPE